MDYPRKRTFHNLINGDNYKYRCMSLEDREEFRNKEILRVVGIGECETVARDLWESLKPHTIKIKAR